MDPDDPRRVAAINAAAARLRVDHTAVEAIRALERAGIPSVVLKGASVARWLYKPEDARTYVDCDLLVPPDMFGSAVAALTAIGFEPELDEAEMPGWWREHALTTFHGDGGAMIDLHRSLPGAHVADKQLWSTLSASTDTIALGDLAARTLTEPGRLLHVALHAAQHGGAQRDLDVLGRAIEQVDEDTWRAAADLANSLEAEAALAQGLTMLPEGASLAKRLGLGPALAIDVELRAAGAVEALTVARLHGTRGIGGRAMLVRHKLFPPATFMRKWSPLARHGRLGLTAAYAYRPIWVLRRTPGAIGAWRHARRKIRHRADATRPR